MIGAYVGLTTPCNHVGENEVKCRALGIVRVVGELRRSDQKS
jgi:hypothetical protein